MSETPNDLAKSGESSTSPIKDPFPVSQRVPLAVSNRWNMLASDESDTESMSKTKQKIEKVLDDQNKEEMLRVKALKASVVDQEDYSWAVEPKKPQTKDVKSRVFDDDLEEELFRKSITQTDPFAPDDTIILRPTIKQRYQSHYNQKKPLTEKQKQRRKRKMAARVPFLRLRRTCSWTFRCLHYRVTPKDLRTIQHPDRRARYTRYFAQKERDLPAIIPYMRHKISQRHPSYEKHNYVLYQGKLRCLNNKKQKFPLIKLPEETTYEDLPLDIWKEIFSFIHSINTFVALRRVCKKFYYILENPSYWKIFQHIAKDRHKPCLLHILLSSAYEQYALAGILFLKNHGFPLGSFINYDVTGSLTPLALAEIQRFHCVQLVLESSKGQVTFTEKKFLTHLEDLYSPLRRWHNLASKPVTIEKKITTTPQKVVWNELRQLVQENEYKQRSGRAHNEPRPTSARSVPSRRGFPRRGRGFRG